MGDFEDDFGDLYADVEAQASSAIIGVSGSIPFRLESSEAIGNDSDDSKINGNCNSGDEAGNGIESEDDLNIVLNDEDCKGKSFGLEARESVKNEKYCRETDEEEGDDDFAAINELKCVGTHGSSSPSGAKAKLFNSMLATSIWDHNVRNQRKGSISGQNALSGVMSNFGSSQLKHGFSLPRYRSILDVNIDAFEEKPWNHPGVDITDFFNFGFNEDTWKQYCNRVDQFRFSALTRLGNPNHVSRNQASEAGCKYDEGPEETMYGNIWQPKGRAIQVEDSFGERQPTIDVWRPRERDSDVVIQIKLEDTSDTSGKLEYSGSTPGKTPSNGELDSANDREEGFAESREENDKRVDRCYSVTNASNPVIVDCMDPRQIQSHEIDDNCHKKYFSSDETIELDAAVNQAMESDTVNARYESMVHPELSLEEEGQLSLVSSCFESDSEASGGCSDPDSGKISCPLRASVNSGVRLRGSNASHQKNLKGNQAKIKPVDPMDYSICKIPIQVERKHRVRRVGSYGSDAENMHYVVHFGRWKEKLQDVDYMDKDFDYVDKEDVANYEESELSTGHDGREFARKHWSGAWKSCTKGAQCFHEERDPYLREDGKERRHLHEYGRREGYLCRPGPFHGNMKHVAHKNETYSRSYRKNDKFQSRKATNYGSQFLDCKLADADFMQERCARSSSLIEQRRDTRDECYNRRLLKHDNRLSRRNAYNDDSRLELEGSWSGKVEEEYKGNIDAAYLSHQSDRTEDDYWANTDAHYSSHQFHRNADGGRWTGPISPRNGVSRSRSIKRYRRQSSLGDDEERGWFDYNDPYDLKDEFAYPDQDPFRRKRRFGRRSEVLSWTEELTVRHQDEKLAAERSFFAFKSDPRHRKDYFSRESLHDERDDMQTDQHSYKITRDKSPSQSIFRTSKMCRVKNEQRFLDCRGSVDLFIGKAKLSGSSRKDRNSRFKSSNLRKVNDQSLVAVRDNDLEIEEGQILGEEPSTRPTERNTRDSRMEVHKAGEECDSQRILETLAKMEKRRERFKDPIVALKKEQDKCPKPEIVPSRVDVLQTKQHRPSRKRQWRIQ